MKSILPLLFFLVGTSTLGIPTLKEKQCALRACNKLDPNKINVHLIPHSHDDVGWLKTVEDYFYGLRGDIQTAGVEYTLDAAVQALQHDPNRRYIQVETAFFWKWWQKQTESKKKIFQTMVDEGKIEIIGGGWTMNDEACVNYQSTINQFTWGLRLLNDTLGECGRPRIGWQIDPFGHSREQASIFKQMGYDAIFFTRLSEDDRKSRKASKDLEFMWKSNDNFENSEIFTSIMDSYYAPSDFCWDYPQCSSDAINDDPDSFEYNLNEKVGEFSEHIADDASYFKTNNILYAMGGDFQYEAAEINFLNIDKLIKGFENHPNYTVFYSTPSCYIEAVLAQKPNLTTKENGDFFPYNENAHVYWAGFYTSRSTLKRYERVANNILQAAHQLNAFAKIKGIYKNDTEYEENVRSLREAVGTMQHHDAITGTEKERVANDYSRIVTTAITDTEKTIGQIIGNLLKKEEVTQDVTLPLSTCLLLNISYCEATMKNKSLLVLYNPLSKNVTYHLRVPVEDGTYQLIGDSGNVNFEIVTHMNYTKEWPLPSAEYELISTLQIPAMAIQVYYLEKTIKNSTAIKHKELGHNEFLTWENKNMKVIYYPKNRTRRVIMNDKEIIIYNDFMYYVSNNGTEDNITSGSYVFRNSGPAISFDSQNDSKILYFQNKYMIEIIEYVNDYIVQTIRGFTDEGNNYEEHDWMVGPLTNKTLDINNHQGKELIFLYSIKDITTNNFYTDSNGRQMITRERTNYLDNDTKVEAVASNYYPVTSKITIKNSSLDFQMSVLTDRSQAGGSLKDGQIELLIHRRTLLDDHKGLEETLEEKEYDDYIVTRGNHYLIYGPQNITRTERLLAMDKLLQPWLLVADATSETMSLEQLQKLINFQWQGLTINGVQGLPPNVNILSFEPWKDQSYLLRIEHIFAKDEDDEYSKEVPIDLKDMFSPYTISKIDEFTLDGNKKIDGKDIDASNPTITIGPMEIRTFVVEIK